MTAARPLTVAFALASLTIVVPATAGPYGAAPVPAASLIEPVTYLHSHHHGAHHYEMTHRNHNPHAPGHFAHGDGSHRSTATGGNPGGFSSRN